MVAHPIAPAKPPATQFDAADAAPSDPDRNLPKDDPRLEPRESGQLLVAPATVCARRPTNR
jgi:hypothetical protein